MYLGEGKEEGERQGKGERQGEGERQAGQDYEFLLWKEGISLYDVVAKGKFPLQVRDKGRYVLVGVDY